MVKRQKIAALVAEFVGVVVLVSAVLSMAGRTSFPFFSAMAAGLTLGVMVLVIGNISGAHINPIVTVGLWSTRKVQTSLAVMYIAAQFLGGVVAWQLNEYLLNQPLRNIAGNSFDWRVLIAEAIGAFVFTFGLFAAISKAYDHARLAAVAGISLALGIMIASLASNGVINPAVAVGIQSWGWAYVLGPFAGALIGMNFYAWVFAPIDNPPSGVKAIASKVARKVKRTAKKK